MGSGAARTVGTLTLSAALALGGCGGTSSAAQAGGDTATSAQAAGTQDAARSAGRTVNVRVATLAPEAFVDRIRLTGTTQARRTVEVKAQVSGQVERLRVEKGRQVERGDVLAEIEDEEIRADLKQARARAKLAEETWRRRQQLFEEENAISKLDYLRAKYDAEEAEGEVEALEARLAHTVIRAPFPGVVDRLPVEVGTMLSPGATVATIVQLRPLEVTAGVPERYAPDIAAGDSVDVSFKVLDGEPKRGVLTFVGATVDPDSRTFPVEVAVPNPDRVIKPEMVAEVRLVRKRIPDALVVPQDAVIRVEDGFAVYVVEEGEAGPVARRRRVTLGPREDDRVVVEEGLAAGDRVVTVGQQQVGDGDRVQVVSG